MSPENKTPLRKIFYSPQHCASLEKSFSRGGLFFFNWDIFIYLLK